MIVCHPIYWEAKENTLYAIQLSILCGTLITYNNGVINMFYDNVVLVGYVG